MSLTFDHTLGSLASSTEVLTINNVGALIVAKGTSAQRPGTPVAGMIRFNTSNVQFEGYDGSSWGSLGSGSGGGSASTLRILVFG